MPAINFLTLFMSKEATADHALRVQAREICTTVLGIGYFGAADESFPSVKNPNSRYRFVWKCVAFNDLSVFADDMVQLMDGGQSVLEGWREDFLNSLMIFASDRSENAALARIRAADALRLSH